MSKASATESDNRWLARLLGGDFLLWSPNIQAEGFLHWDRIFATRAIRRGPEVHALPRAARELSVSFEDQGRH